MTLKLSEEKNTTYAEGFLTMDGSLVPSLVPPGQEMSFAFPGYFAPFEYHPHVLSSRQPPATSFVAPAKRTKKSKLSTAESGQPKNRWRAHKKDTCQCAVCKQVRGELSSTWFNHDRANCKCSVCRQARGEKRSLKAIVPAEPKPKTSLISNRVRRLTGRHKVSTSQSGPVLPEQDTRLLSDCSRGQGSVNGSRNLPSEAMSTELSNLILAVPSYPDEARVNRVYGPSTWGSDSSHFSHSMREMIGSHTRDNVADSTHSSEAKHQKSDESSEKFRNLSSLIQNVQLNSDRLIFSWKHNSSFSGSRPGSPCQTSSQAIGTVRFNSSADLTGVSTTAHFSASAVGCSSLSSAAPDSQSDVDGTRLNLSSMDPASWSQSGSSCLLSPDIMGVQRGSKSADLVVVSEGTHSSGFWTESLRTTPTVSVSQLETEGKRSGWSGGPIAKANKAVPCLVDTQPSAYTSNNKSSDLALACVPEVPSPPLQGACSVNGRKRNWTCTDDENTCACDGCVPRTSSSELLCGPKFMRTKWISSAVKRQRIFSLSIKPLHATLHGVGLLSSVYPLAFQRDEIIAKMSSKILPSGQHDASGLCQAPANTDSEQASCSSGSFPSPTTSSPKHDSVELQIASCSSRCTPMFLASLRTSGVIAASFPVFFSDQAGQTVKVVVKDVYRCLFSNFEQIRGTLPGSLTGREWGACRSYPASDSLDHRRRPHQAQPITVGMPSQKSADIRVHRSQSALLLGEQPCSLLKVAHIDLPCKQDPLTLIAEEPFSPKGLLQNVRDSESLSDVRKSSPVCSFRLSLQGSLGSHQARPFHELLIHIYTQDTGNQRAIIPVWKFLALPYTRTVPRCSLNRIRTVSPYVLRSSLSVSPYVSRSSLSVRRRENCSSSCTKTEENIEFSGVSRLVSVEPIRYLRVVSLTFVAQNGVIVQEQVGDEREHANLGSDVAAEPLLKRRRVSHTETQLSVMLPVTCRRTLERLGSLSASATCGTSKHGVLQLSVLKSPRELVTTCQGNLSGGDGMIFVVEAEKAEDDLSANKDQSYLECDSAECSTAKPKSDLPCQTRGKVLMIDAATQTGQNQQTRKKGTSCQDRSSVLSSGLSFKQLLSSVSQSDAVCSLGISSNGDSLSIQNRFRTGEEKCSRCISPKAQELQTATESGKLAYNFAVESRMRDESFSREAPMMEDSSERNHEDGNLTGDMSSLPDVPPVDCNSSKSNGTEGTLPRHSFGCSDEYSSTGEPCMTNISVDLEKMKVHLGELVNLSPGMQESWSEDEMLPAESTTRRSHPNKVFLSLLHPATLSPPLGVLSGKDNVAALENDSTNTEYSVTTKSSISVLLDFDEIEVVQTNVLVEQEKPEFEQKLQTVLEKPFDTLELEELRKSVSVRKPQMRLRESRHETRHVPLRKEGYSYLEHYPDFGRKLETTNDPQEQLKLLRGFFFWIQHTCMSGAFMPWEEKEEDDDCVQIIEEKCTVTKRSGAGTPNRSRKVQRRGQLVGETRYTRESRPESSTHMSLRARKKAVYTDKPGRAKKIAKQRITPKVKTEDNVHTFPSILKKKSATCLVGARRRTSLSEGKK